MKKESGFSLIELLIAGGLIALAFTSVSAFLLFSRDTTLKTKRNTEAVTRAEEAIEAVRKLRDDGWAANIATLTSGTTYYPVISGGKWTLSTTNPGASSGYTTRVVFSDVNRDANDNISASGTLDADTKKLVSTVSWSDTGTKSVQITTYITNFNDN